MILDVENWTKKWHCTKYEGKGEINPARYCIEVTEFWSHLFLSVTYIKYNLLLMTVFSLHIVGKLFIVLFNNIRFIWKK